MKKIPSLFFFLLLTGCITHEEGQMQFSTTNPSQSRAKVAEGLKDLQAGYTNIAKENFELAYQENPHDPIVLDGYGYYYEKTGEINKANQYFTAALLYSPHSAVALNNYGAFLCRNGYYQASTAYFQKAAEVQNDPHSQTSKINMQFCMQEQQRALGGSAIYAYHMPGNGFSI
jgi:type IV pilus assembly protein PilF